MGAALSGTIVDVSSELQERGAKQKEAENNRLQANEAAADALARGAIEASQMRMRGSAITSKQRVAYAVSGVDSTVGTPAQVMADTRAMSELDAMTIENNAAREAYGFKRHGLKFMDQAALDRQRSNNKLGGTLLTSSSRFASEYGESHYDRKK